MIHRQCREEHHIDGGDVGINLAYRFADAVGPDVNLRQIGDGNPAQQIAINAWQHHRGTVGDDPAEEFVDARFVVAGEVAGNGLMGGK